jgi:predicted RND superfamily exporter protein
VIEPRSRAQGASAFVDWTLRWGTWLWAAAIALTVPAALRTADLYRHLHSEIEQLLPRSAPSVVALDELRARMPGLQHLGVVVDSTTAAELPAAERFLDDLATRVRAYPPDLVRSVRTGDAPERAFVRDRAPLYVDLGDLETVRARIEARRDWEAAQHTGALLDEDAGAPPLDFHDIEAKYDARIGAAGRFEDDRFANRPLHLALLLVELGQIETGRGRDDELLKRVRSDIAALDPARYSQSHSLRLGFTGDVAINVEETDALKADLTLSSIVVAVLEVVVLLLYYRWWPSVVVLLAPLVIAAVWTFAGASLYPLRVTELNSNTAFLGSILLGNGINFGIILLARYVEERRRGTAVRDALVAAVDGARTGTSAAALAAGVSYASLVVTDFRGFRQFGVLGGLGMALSWLLAFVLMPPLTAWLDRAPRIPPLVHAPMGHVVALVTRHRVAILVASAVLAAGAAWEVRAIGADRIETDFSKLRRADTWKRGEGYWGRRMDALLGTYLTPTVILTDGVPQARAIAAVLRPEIERPPLEDTIARIRTLDDAVPARQTEKIAIAQQIRADLTPKIRASITPQQRQEVERLLGRGPLRPVTIDDVPGALMTGLRERDGSVGKAVLVYPRPTRATWEGPALAEIVGRLRSAAETKAAPGDSPGRVAGSLALSDDILRSMRRDAALSSVTAFAGVVVAVLFLLRWSRATALVIGSLVLAVLWLGGAAAALGVKINFANFIAYPITFGIGVDYSVNVASRWNEGGRASIAGAVRTTGGAVVLCSATTIIGYSSLLLAQNRALFLFGLLAVLGEAACLTTAVVVMPAVIECFGIGHGQRPRRRTAVRPLSVLGRDPR